MHLTKPKPSDRERIINGLIQCPGVAVQVRTLSENIRHVGTESINVSTNECNVNYIKLYI